jgi:hypothetical protein
MYAGLQEKYRTHSREVLIWAEEEMRAGLKDFARYERFAKDVEKNRQTILTS